MAQTYSILQAIDNEVDSLKLSIPKGKENEKMASTRTVSKY